MSFLFLIRHGQASAKSKDYDQLSSLGYEQSQLAGLALAQKKIQKIYFGPKKRHLQSYQSAAQPSWPQPERTVSLDEFPAKEMITHGLSQLVELEPKLMESAQRFRGQIGTASQEYGILLKRLTYRWIRGEIAHPKLEPFLQYINRLQSFIALVKSEYQQGQNILAFTSAGTIASLCGLLLEGDSYKSIRMAWSLYNASISTVKLTKSETVLSGFNWVEHLPKNKRSFL